MSRDERAAIAREVLMQAVNELTDGAGVPPVVRLTPAQRGYALGYVDREYPAPPAPVTVTVGDWTYRDCLSHWMRSGRGTDAAIGKSEALGMAVSRIASDARRIAELEDAAKERESLIARLDANCVTLQRERDAAVRALEKATQSRAVPSSASRNFPDDTLPPQGGTGASTGPSRPEKRDGAPVAPECRDMAPVTPAPASESEPRSAATPIPLGAVVDGYIREPSGWRGGGLGIFIRDDSNDRAPLITALYHARHPVATRETVDAVRKLLRLSSQHGDTFAETADAVLVALGYTLQEGV